MKRIAISLAIFLISMSLLTMEKEEKPAKAPQEIERDGLFLGNQTPQPIFFAWYKTKIGGIIGCRYPFGPKERITEVLPINVHDKLFTSKPVDPGKWDNYTTDLQLLVSYTKELLTPSIAGDTSGIIQDPVIKDQIVLVDLPAVKPRQMAAEEILIERPGTKRIEQQKKLGPGWYFDNKTDHAFYFRWYETGWDTKRRDYINPRLIKGQEIIMIQQGAKIFIPLPLASQISAKAQPMLLFAFNKPSLEANIDSPEDSVLPPVILGRTPRDLGSYQSTYNIKEEQGAPYLESLAYAIKVTNTLNEPRYCAIYYLTRLGTAEKYGGIQVLTKIEPQMSEPMQYPQEKAQGQVILVVADDANKRLLEKAVLSEDELKLVFHRDFGKLNVYDWIYSGEFAINADVTTSLGIRVSSLGSGFWFKLLRKVRDISTAEGPVLEEFENRFRAKDPLYLPDEAIVRAKGSPSIVNSSSELKLENDFKKVRLEKARKAINKLVGRELIKEGSKVPTIALVFTGGGWRAMTQTIGFLRGAAQEETGNVFDCATYMMGLSGSTWAINPLVVSGLSPQEFSNRQRTKVGRTGVLTPGFNYLVSELINQSPEYIERRFIQSRYYAYPGIVGWYGHSLAHALLKDYTVNNHTTHNITLSDMRSNLQSGQYPLPVSVAVFPGNKEETRMWYEFSPFYIGSFQEKAGWVDCKLFGCPFKDGKPVQASPEYPLAVYMGIFGSAFALSIDDIAKVSQPAGWLLKGIAQIRSGLSWAYNYLLALEPKQAPCVGRFTGGEFSNFAYGAKGANPGLRDLSHTCLVDGGTALEGVNRHNFATVPALNRKVDIVIMCDSIDTPNADVNSEHLRSSDEEARRLRLNFPDITRGSEHREVLQTMHADVASLFIEEGAPIVVYMKTKKNQKYNEWLSQNALDAKVKKAGFDPDAGVAGFTATTNFNYSPEQFDLLTGLTESIFIQAKDKIKQAIEAAVAEKHKKAKK